MNTAINLEGQRFHRLVALRPERVGGRTGWLCRCDCGAENAVRTGSLSSGKAKSCGCLNLEASTKHGHNQRGNQTSTYRSWHSMLQRCSNPNNKRYASYGGRGIRVCKRWETFPNFLADMGDRPPRTTLDRKDNNGPYSPDNCRWTTPAEQSRNTSRNRMLTHAGITQCVTDWAKTLGVHPSTLRDRIRSRGWPQAMTIAKAAQP